MRKTATVVKPLSDAESRRVIRQELAANLLVEAGAGSGKTQMLAERMAAGIASGVYKIEHLAAVSTGSCRVVLLLPACRGGGVRIQELCFSVRVRFPRCREVGPPEVGTTFLGQPFRLRMSPCGDPSVMAREENRVSSRPSQSVGRVYCGNSKSPAGEGFLTHQVGIPEDAPYKPDRGVDQGHEPRSRRRSSRSRRG